jgi:mannose-1-phosphate guanylyltransferase
MVVVIIAGGSGTRLWPLSTKSYPKHLLSLTNDKSLLQNTYERVSMVTSNDKIYVVTEASHSDHVAQHLPLVPAKNIIIEPARRGTASCVVLALSRIAKDFAEDQPVLFLWADHIVRNSDGFASSVLRAATIAQEQRKLVFMGIDPSYPSTGFGYMKMGKQLGNWQGVYEFDSFKEKPNAALARQYFDSGKYLWNTGYLTGMRSDFVSSLKQHNKSFFEAYQNLYSSTSKTENDVYLGLENDAIDYALSERISSALLVLGTFDWADLGSFADLHSVSLQDDSGNHMHGSSVYLDGVTNSYVRNDTDTPVAVIGLDGVVVVNTPNGLLVSNRNHAQRVGEIAKQIQK